MGSIDGLDLGTFGLYTFDFEVQPAALIRESVQELEERGWRALWVPELLGRDALTHAGYLLSSTERMRVVNGIAQIWSRGARWAYGAALLLADAYPDRHVLGLGFGGGQGPGTKPLAAMTAYLDEMDAVETPNPLPKTPMRRIMAAYGPKMLELARERTAGAQTYHVNVAHTAQAREILGPNAFLGVEHAVLFESDPDRARAIARMHLHVYLNSPTTSLSSVDWATPRRRSPMAATASSTTSCSGATWTPSSRSSMPMSRPEPIMSRCR